MSRLLVRLLAILGVALLPALVFHGYTEWSARQARQQLMRDKALDLLRHLQAEQRAVFQAGAQVLAALAVSEAMRGADPGACGRRLAALIRELPRYNAAFVADRTGRVICVSRPRAGPLSVADRGYFARALATGGFVIGDYQIGHVTQEPEIELAQPLRGDDGAVIGVIGVSIAVAWLERRLAEIGLPPGASAGIVDRNGIVVARVPDGARFAGQPISADQVPLLHGSETRINVVTSLDGVRRLAAFAPQDADRFALPAAVGIDPAVTFTNVLRDNRTGLVLLAGGALAAFVLTLLLGRSLISLPAERLVAAAQRWRAGELRARTGLRGDRSEFGRLAAALEDMADRLHARECALRMALESTGDAVFVFDRDWRYTFVNERGRTLLGRDPTGGVIWDIMPETVGTKLAAALHRAMEGDEPVHAEGFSVSLGRDVEWTAYPSTDGLTVFCRDLTEQRRAQAALRDSEARLQLAREAAGFGVWDRDYTEAHSYVCDNFWRMLGLRSRPNELDLETWSGCLHPQDRARALAERDAAIAARAERVEQEYRVLHPDGTVRWLRTWALYQFAPDGSRRRAVGVAMDVTRERLTEDALRIANERFALALKAAPITLFSQDRELRYQWLHNPPGGFEDRDVIGKTEHDAVSSAADAETLAAIKREVMRTGIGQRQDVSLFDGGTEYRFDLLVEPLRGRDGEVQGVICAAIDVTARKRLEEELRGLTRVLEERVAAEVAAREAAQARAAHAERMQALGQLAGGIAHDFNNVLQAIGGAMTMMARRADDAAAIRRLATLAGEAAERGAAITRRLLAFSRRADLRPEPIDPADLLHNLQEILTHTLGAGITVGVEAEGGLPPVAVDKSQLETSLINLATNARDAMPEGGRLTFSAMRDVVRPGVAHESGLAPGPYVRLTVSDTGTGMDSATLARASEPFFTTKQVGSGTGLGLAMTRGFAEQSGGAFRLASHPGAGTTVTLWLPAAAETVVAVPAQQPQSGPPPPEGARPRVLLVDDEAGVREVLALALAEGGYDVRAADSGERALEIIVAEGAPDALVTDLSMPGLSGVALIRAAQARHPDLPALLLTGYAGDGAAQAVGGAVSGAFTLLRKPLAGQQLLDRLGAVLAGRAAVL